MNEDAASNSSVRFGIFEADLKSRELRRSGVMVRLQDQPFRVLMLLLESPGTVVSREELHRRVWGTDPGVDLDHSLKTAINKIREALKDSADNPRFIETLPRRGYRFIAPVTFPEESEEIPEQLPPITAPISIASSEMSAPPPSAAKPSDPEPPPMHGSRIWLWCGCLLFCLVGITVLLTRRSHEALHPITQITFTGRISPSAPHTENFASFAVDGLRLYVTQIEHGKPALAETAIADGEVSLLSVPPEIAAPIIDDLSPDESKLLVHNHLTADIEQPLSIVPAHGGMARPIPNIVAHAATWMPDGKRILYANGDALSIADEDGSNIHQFALAPGRAFWLRWSPNGKELRFTVLDSFHHTSTLWKITADGNTQKPLLPEWSEPTSECCGSWTPDGRYFVFQSSHGAMSNIWDIDEKGSAFGRRQPVQLTSGPLAYQSPVPARSGHKIFFLGTEQRHAQLSYDLNQKAFNPSPVTMFGTDRTEFSRNGERVAWIRNRDGTLWCGRSDGTNRIQISSPPAQVWLMHWSPDGKRLAYMGRQPGQPWKLYIVDNATDSSKILLKEDRNEADPDWSPDGSHLVFGRLPDFMSAETATKDIEVINLKDSSVNPVPGSQGRYAPRWSPDGKYIAAMPLDQRRLILFDTETHAWRVLLDREIANPTWASDAKSIFFQAFTERDQPIYRVWLADGHVERIVGLGEMPNAGIVDFSFSSLAPGDVPLIRARTWTANIYSIDIDK
jgi:Tol biopolymer transport system component/DNA-binding winged helix-turn-helix (wHTH) protein